MTEFLTALRPVLDRRLTGTRYAVAVDQEFLAGAGGNVEVLWGDWFIRFVQERMFDFDVEVAFTNAPTKWHRLSELLALEAGGRVERADVAIRRRVAELDDLVRRFCEREAALAALLAPERMPDTLASLEELRRRTMHPGLRGR